MTKLHQIKRVRAIGSIVESAPNAGFAMKLLAERGIIAKLDTTRNRYSVYGYVFWQSDETGYHFYRTIDI